MIWHYWRARHLAAQARTVEVEAWAWADGWLARRTPEATPRHAAQAHYSAAHYAIEAKDLHARAAVHALIWFLSPEPYGPIL